MYLVSLFAFLSLGSLLADGLLYFRGGKVRENNGSETWHGEKWDVKLNWNSSSKSSKSTKSNSLANFALVQFLAQSYATNEDGEPRRSIEKIYFEEVQL